MRKTFTLLLAIFCVVGVTAQTNVSLKINHKLGAKGFAFNQTAQNNLGHDFNLNRLEYYISEIVIIHDGGIMDTVPNTWLLVNASSTTNEALGSYNITTLEGVRFGIGVNQAVNHDDPALLPMTHPLAPKAPSMHWGWTAGYRFVAMEGKSGAQLNQSFQIHALGDNNYNYATVNTAGTTNGSDLVIDLEADYTMAIKDIDISAGLINHGETGEAVVLLNNFSTDVFKATGAVGIDEVMNPLQFSLAPNPAQGKTKVMGPTNWENASIEVTELTGKVIRTLDLPLSGELEIELPQGFYLVTLKSNLEIISSKKLVVTE